MQILNYDATMRQSFEDLLTEYFLKDLNMSIPEDIIRGKLTTLILDNCEKEINHLVIATENTIPIGFSIYQIDTPLSDWCKRPGWGFIREFFIKSAFRRKGFGSELARFTQQHLRDLGAEQIYLTSDDAAEFWIHCGFLPTSETDTNGLQIFVK